MKNTVTIQELKERDSQQRTVPFFNGIKIQQRGFRLFCYIFTAVVAVHLLPAAVRPPVSG